MYVKTVTLTTNQQSIDVIKDNCYSELLGASRDFSGVVADNALSFSYVALAFGDILQEQKTVVTFDVGLCVENIDPHCSTTYSTANCPGRDAEGNDFSGLHYSIDGFEHS